MKFVYTHKAERDGIGKAGEPIKTDESGDHFRYALVHGYAVEVEDPAPLDASLSKPPSDSVVRKGKK